MSRKIYVRFGAKWAEVRGHGSREMYVELRGRAPVWVASSRSWSLTTKTALDMIALAERRGYEVEISGQMPPARGAHNVSTSLISGVAEKGVHTVETPVERGGLW